MTRSRNCPNCGAPYNVELVRCPYCGTAYYDLSAIDMSSSEPFYLKMKVDGFHTTQLVVPEFAEMTTRRDSVYATGRFGNVLCEFNRSVELITKLTFHAVPNKDGVCMVVEKEDNS